MAFARGFCQFFANHVAHGQVVLVGVADRAERESVQIFCRRLGWNGLWEDVVLGYRHRDIALAIPPEEPIEQYGVYGVGVAEIQILAFFPFLGIHLVDEAIVAVAIVGGEGGLLTGAGEERGHERGAGVVGIHGRGAEERLDGANHVDGRIERMIDKRSSGGVRARGWERGVLADDQGDAAVGVDVVGAVLGVVLENEERGIVPIGAVRYRVNNPPDRQVIVSNRRSRPGFVLGPTSGVVVRKPEKNELWQGVLMRTA